MTKEYPKNERKSNQHIYFQDQLSNQAYLNLSKKQELPVSKIEMLSSTADQVKNIKIDIKLRIKKVQKYIKLSFSYKSICTTISKDRN